MLKRFSYAVSRWWFLVFLGWAAAFAFVRLAAPVWDDVARDGDFAYLPDTVASVQGEKLRDAAFGEVRSKSEVVLVLARRDGPLTKEDLAFADEVVATFTPKKGEETPILDIIGPRTPVVGEKLISPPGENGQAALVILQMQGEIMAVENMEPMSRIYDKFRALDKAETKPAGLTLGITGSGAIGTDMLFAAEESIKRTEWATIGLIILILLVVYRAPILAAVPLIAIAIAVFFAFDVIAILADISMKTNWYEFAVFKTTKIFVVVVLFGAGTDYCLFLIARYKEELANGHSTQEATALALERVTGALAASALTTILGLGTMAFADFGKFRSGGPAIAICLVIALAACLTLAPAILRVLGKYVFWPFSVHEGGSWDGESDGSAESEARAQQGGRFRGFWVGMSNLIIARPGWVLVVGLLVMAPFAWHGRKVTVTYDLLNELGRDRLCVQGTHLLREYFPAGETGPVTVLVYMPGADFSTGPDRFQRLPQLVDALYKMEYTDSNGKTFRPIQSVRSLVEPLGERTKRRVGLFGGMRRGVISGRAKEIYVAQQEPYTGCVTRLDLIFPYDPFSLESIRLLDHVEKFLNDYAAKEDSPFAGAEFYFLGTTPGIRDLKAITASDQLLIQKLVPIAVLFVLILIIRRPFISIYLVLSVMWGYFVTIGMTQWVFEWLHGASYHGLDWKLPTFLFVILVAIGEDYNIYLVTRVFEEQEKRGMVEGLRAALIRTGGIITSCGIIMAGTFAAMITGSLRTMHQLGFALAMGVLLDTFVIRTIMVPSFMLLWGRFCERFFDRRRNRETRDATSLPAESSAAPRHREKPPTAAARR
ncbi:MAG: MMPL family transporter [Planctomycetota bacterium]|nr:MAG: MMPL family transporter [Planctomycetota bacterium]